jgi:hypothetical protein
MSNKKLLILERSGDSLKQTNDNDSVVLEGVFTQIGVRNRNNRIYEEKEFLPHVKDLQEKVKSSKLLGELDHPKQFDISLNNVSHVIEKLEYDPSTKQVIGRIRLLDTDKGKQAKALIEGGIPLHISSRASGRVDENGKVKIQKLFTYDLVADPGFANAELHRVNESFGFTEDESILIYEMDENDKAAETPIETLASEANAATTNEETETKNKNTEAQMENFVTAEDFNKYTEYVKKEFNSLKEGLGNSDNATIEKLIAYTNHLSEKMNQMHGYMTYLAENLDNSIQHGDYVVENLNKVKDYTNYLAENLEHGVAYTEYVGKKVDEAISYAEHVAEGADNAIEYGKYLGENMNKTVAYAEYLKENVEKLGSYANYIAESLNKIQEGKVAVATTEAVVESVNENANPAPAAPAVDYKSSVEAKLNILLESAMAKKEQENLKKDDLHFFRFLDNSKRVEFQSLNEGKQNEIVEKFKTNKYFSSSDANRIWESNFITEAPASLDVVTNMPDKYREKWESLNESQRSTIMKQAKAYPLDSQYQINNFWQTRDLRTTKVNFEKIDESIIPGATATAESATNDSMNQIKETLKARFNNLR